LGRPHNEYLTVVIIDFITGNIFLLNKRWHTYPIPSVQKQTAKGSNISYAYLAICSKKQYKFASTVWKNFIDEKAINGK
jgi:hypothetical protein